jgi:hypothetical protein
MCSIYKYKELNVKPIRAPDVHFDYSSLFSDDQVEKVGNPKKSEKLENQTECHEIEPNSSKDRAMPEGDNPSF